jgi:hypothetical protein
MPPLLHSSFLANPHPPVLRGTTITIASHRTALPAGMSPDTSELCPSHRVTALVHRHLWHLGPRVYRTSANLSMKTLSMVTHKRLASACATSRAMHAVVVIRVHSQADVGMPSPKGCLVQASQEVDRRPVTLAHNASVSAHASEFEF